MKSSFHDFIGVFEDTASKEDCQKIIDHFENVNDLNLTVNRKDLEEQKSILKNNKLYLMINEQDSLLMRINQGILKGFVDNLSTAYDMYRNKYDVMESLDLHKLNVDVKIQITKVPALGFTLKL